MTSKQKGQNLRCEDVVSVWMKRGIFQLYYAYEVELLHGDVFKWQEALHKTFHLAMGFEQISKAYILGMKREHYEKLPLKEGREKINKIAKTYNHNYRGKILHKLQDKNSGIAQNVIAIMNKNYWRVRGCTMLDALEEGFILSRYPQPETFKIRVDQSGKSSVLIDPFIGTDLAEFCYAICGVIVEGIGNDFHQPFPEEELIEQYGEKGQRFIEMFRRYTQ